VASSLPSICASTSRRAALPFLLLLALLAGCGGGSGKREGASGGAPPGAAGTETAASGGDADTWRNRYTGLPDPGDPRLMDLSFLVSLTRDGEVEVALGDYFFAQDEFDSALVHYDAALAWDDSSQVALNRKATALQRENRYGDAQKVLLHAIDLDPLYIHSHINLGTLHHRQEEYDKAIAEYTIATTIDSTVATAWYNMGLAYEAKEDLNDALQSYYKVIDCDPNDPKPWEKIGFIYYRKKLYRGARERFMEVLARDPSRDDIREHVRTLEAYADSTGTQ